MQSQVGHQLADQCSELPIRSNIVAQYEVVELVKLCCNACRMTAADGCHGVLAAARPQPDRKAAAKKAVETKKRKAAEAANGSKKKAAAAE